MGALATSQSKPALSIQASSNCTPNMASPSPAGQARPKKIDPIGAQSDGLRLAADLPAAMGEVPEEAKPWALVFGDSVVRYYHSGDWKEREQSLSSIQRSLTSPKFLSGKDSKAVFSAASEMVAKTLKDKVAPIFHASLELVSTMLTAFSPLLDQPSLRQGVDPLMPILVHRCGNLNSRIHEASLQTLVSVASFPSFGVGYVGPFAIAELAKRGRDASHSAAMYGRLDLVCALLSTYRTMADLSVEAVLAFCKLGLEMPDDKVRQAAIRAVVEVNRLQRASGKDLKLESQLGGLKPALMQMLQKRCAEDADEGGLAVVASSPSPKGDARKLPALGSGIKVFGKGLPPIGGGGATSMPDPYANAGVTSLMPSASVKQSPSSLGRKERLRMADMGAAEASPTGPLSASNRLHKSPKSPSSNFAKMNSRRQIDSALDDTEEQLIQYLMDEQRA